jgi:hypothetical protein
VRGVAAVALAAALGALASPVLFHDIYARLLFKSKYRPDKGFAFATGRESSQTRYRRS